MPGTRGLGTRGLVASLLVALVAASGCGSEGGGTEPAAVGSERPDASAPGGGPRGASTAVGPGSTVAPDEAPPNSSHETRGRDSDQSGASTDGTARGGSEAGAGGGEGDDGPAMAERFGSLPVEAELEVACVEAGEAQAITVRTEPGAGVAYHAVYADGATAADEDYPGGNRAGVADPTGTWRDTWVVGSGAAPGEVRVDVVAKTPDDDGYHRAGFAVADEHGACP